MPPSPEPRYCDYYGMMSYADYLLQLAAGTLSSFIISTGQDQP